MKIVFLILIFLSTLISSTTICYKEKISRLKIKNNVLLDGGECKGKMSLAMMKKNGWKIEHSQIVKKSSKYNYLVLFSKNDGIKAKKDSHLSINFDIKKIKLQSINGDLATINVGKLIVGQSGVIVRKINNKTIIIAKAIVKSSSVNASTLLISKSNILTQNAIPTLKLKPQINDIFILNHIYNSSLLIVPNFEALQKIKKLYPKQHFLDPDIFAAYLKMQNLPSPTLKDMQRFCKDYDIGTIFILAQHYLYILDVESLQLIKKAKLYINSAKTQSPFFTKITDIKESLWDFNNEEIKDYNHYYTSIINKIKYHSSDENIFMHILDILK